ncbi:RNA polymerase II transcriptional coactivator KELP [Penicillium atrosanguineum]|uniref:RNA polymerase II transcriptional coactivator KELP n=1 Tax=Penicillium atrosanguineum TaxID=1132637 RepID=A0A9W9H8H9_9EURO|nr:Pre-mRNA-splicing factor srp1 [Penicillium atrosanguineum]KAJ5122858.1 RNA polymerase II transcriptional coactivator KELP [Penicillium atrosanguineum]KAJ5140585.1 RNA polymerase II transcriptional coactivator KELP [Penicillium atrosanguineum]KAJ5310495.1 Pre-mRNA-splicing factor srp1 [Penicillium atrosanguineum]KAJ5316017.1 RNA polymerase II transcriptional coactivator KELP [Penicillium atrosanguineum]
MTSRKRSSESQGLGEDVGIHSKKSKANTGETTSKVDTNGDRYWEISKMRRVTISSFRGKNMVNVREYYEKDGQELPGKKGISMPMDQFSALIKLLPDIEQALKQQGESLPRPIYSSCADQPGDGNDEPERTASPYKQNIEATSDEESEA